MTSRPRYFQIADISIEVNSDLPIRSDTFDPKFETFRIEQPGKDLVRIFHHFEHPEIDFQSLGDPAYQKAPWAIYPRDNGWLYLGTLPDNFKESFWKVALFNHDHSVGHIYHLTTDGLAAEGLHALTGFPTDQIWLARLLADRRGCYIHSAGAIINGKGFLFVGHSEAGKSTTTQMLLDAKYRGNQKPLDIEILCDDRNIVRYDSHGWEVYGSWSHGDVPIVSANASPLNAICFLEQAPKNELILLTDHQKIFRRLMACVIKPFVDGDWWHKTINVIVQLANEVPCYAMRFDKSGRILREILRI